MPDRNTGGPDSPTATWPSPASLISTAHRAGQDVGRVSALAAFRLGELAASAVATISASGAGGQSPDEPGNRPPPHDGPEVSVLTRAEAIVGRAGHQAAAMTAGMREQLMRSAALAREEAEDIMVDAQQLRQHGRDATRAS